VDAARVFSGTIIVVSGELNPAHAASPNEAATAGIIHFFIRFILIGLLFRVVIVSSGKDIKNCLYFHHIMQK